MTTYKMSAPDGNTYQIDGPEGATDDQVRQQILKQHPTAGTPKQEQLAPAAAPSSGVGDFFKSIPSGALKGVSSLMSATGRAAQGEMMQQPDTDIPSGEEISGILQKEVTGEVHKPEGLAGRIGEGIGEAAVTPTTYLGPGGPVVKTAGAIGSAIGSEGLGYLTEGTGLEPYARFLGGTVAGGLVGGAGAVAKSSALDAALPTAERIEKAANEGYKLMRAADVKISEQGVKDLSTDIKTKLADKDFYDITAPSTFKLIETQLDTLMGPVDVGKIDKIRSALGKVSVTHPEDRVAAGIARDSIDDWLLHIAKNNPSQIVSGDPNFAAALLTHSQQLWKAHKQLEDIEAAGEKAMHRAGSTGAGANVINTKRQEIRKILDSDKKSRGLSQPVKDQMEKIVVGSWASNNARYLSKYAPTGPVSASATVLADIQGGLGAATAVAGTGFLAKYLGEYLTSRQITELEGLIRAETPIGKAAVPRYSQQIAEANRLPAAGALRGAVPALAYDQTP